MIRELEVTDSEKDSEEELEPTSRGRMWKDGKNLLQTKVDLRLFLISSSSPAVSARHIPLRDALARQGPPRAKAGQHVVAGCSS